jgi:hypothetical protein
MPPPMETKMGSSMPPTMSSGEKLWRCTRRTERAAGRRPLLFQSRRLGCYSPELLRSLLSFGAANGAYQSDALSFARLKSLGK